MQGLSQKTLRVWPTKARLPGLSSGDDTVIRLWLQALDVRGWSLHTHVPVGFDCESEIPEAGASVRVIAEACLPFRADAVLEFADHVWILEGKPGCRHHAIGQVLAYDFWWGEREEWKPVERRIIVTDVCSPPVRRFAEAYGVEVAEVGPVLGDQGPVGYFVAVE